MKKFVSLFLSAILILSGVSFAFAETSSARLYNVYGNGMLFQQNKEAVFAGVAASGTEIEAKLVSADGTLVASGVSQANADGTFEVSFDSPLGGYEEYTVILSENSIEFAKLENITVSDEEYAEKLNEYYQFYTDDFKSAAEMEAHYGKDQILETVLYDKVVEYIFSVSGVSNF